jgi:hypothetical protein
MISLLDIGDGNYLGIAGVTWQALGGCPHSVPLEAFPLGTPDERRCFELLRKAYVDARYKPSYRITREELEWLAARVQYLRELADRLCRERIESF